MTQRTTDQNSLFEMTSDAQLIHEILSMPKIDLHRHLTGAIDAETAVKIAAKYNVELPTYVISELEDLLFKSDSANTLQQYFHPWWEILNKLFVSKEAIHDIILEVIKKAAEDNIIYLELRMGPRGFLGNNIFTFEQFIEAVSESVAEANATFNNIITRCILGIPRHVFGNIRPQTRNRMLARMVSIISSFRQDCFVGVDLNGDEDAISGKEFEVFFKIAKDKGLGITVHAGECGSTSNVREAVDQLYAQRIGHGLAAVHDADLLRILAERNCALEICPESNRILRKISRIEELPLKILQEYGVPFVICSDNTARNRTSLSQELFKIAKAFRFSSVTLKEITLSSLKHSFTDLETKKSIKSKLYSVAC